MLKWNLDELFTSDEAFYEKIEQYIKIDINDDNLLEIVNFIMKIKENINNILIYGSLKYYKNINDDNCITMKNIAEKLNSDVENYIKIIQNRIIGLGKDKIELFVNQNNELEVYKLYLDNLFRLGNHLQEDNINNFIKENNNLINEQISNYNNLLRDIKYGSIIIGGEDIEITSANYAKYISSRDREIRKQAYLVTNASFKEQESEFASVLNSIYENRFNNARLEQYSSVLEKVLYEENIDIKIIDTLINYVNSKLPLIQKYLNLKDKYLNIVDPHLYDFGVPLDNNLKIKYTLEETIIIIKNALEPLGEEYLQIVDLLLEGHVDATLDENKHQSIVFSWNTFSFMNFRGSYIDIKNLIHELGHIVNYYLSKQKQPFIYEDSTIFVGETASTINETLLIRYLYNNAKTEEEKVFYLSKEIENYFTLVFKQTMYTEFENDLYNQISSNQKLSSSNLNEKYNALIKKYYGNDIFYDEVSNIEWTRLGHIQMELLSL